MDVRHVRRKDRRQAAAQLDEPDRRRGGTTRSLRLWRKRILVSASAARARISLVRAPRESDNAIGVDASIPMARARCCVTISSGAFGLHSSTNSCSRWSSRLSTGKANNTSPGALTRIGLRACSSPKARLTLRCSSLPNRAEVAGECAAFICGPSFTGRVRGTPKVLNHSARNQMDFSDRLADSSIDNSRDPEFDFAVQLSNFPTRKFASPDAWESFVELFS